MYSTFISQDIKIIDIDILNKEENKNDLINEVFNGETIDFSIWDGYKIEGYWYEDTVLVLKMLASVIEGYAEFLYEDGYRFRIVFENGKVYKELCKEVWIKESREEIK